jgi:hypothetical protein
VAECRNKSICHDMNVRRLSPILCWVAAFVLVFLAISRSKVLEKNFASSHGSSSALHPSPGREHDNALIRQMIGDTQLLLLLGSGVALQLVAFLLWRRRNLRST